MRAQTYIKEVKLTLII